MRSAIGCNTPLSSLKSILIYRLFDVLSYKVVFRTKINPNTRLNNVRYAFEKSVSMCSLKTNPNNAYVSDKRWNYHYHNAKKVLYLIKVVQTTCICVI